MTNEATLLEAMRRLWPEVVADPPFPIIPNHCVLAARTAVEVGRYFGFTDWRACPVDFAVFNEAGFDHYARGVPVEDWPEEAYSVGSKCGQPGDAWGGHMILVTPDHLCDLSAKQFDRPKRHLHVEPWVLERPTELPPWHFTDEDGMLMYIDPRPEITAHRGGGDWRRNYKPFSAALIRRLKAEGLPSADAEAQATQAEGQGQATVHA